MRIIRVEGNCVIQKFYTVLQYSNIDTIFPLSSVQSQPTELRLWFCNTSLKLLVRLIDIWHFRSDGEPLSWLPATLINFAFYWDISHSKTYFYPHRYTINFEREERRIQVNIVKSKATWSAWFCCLQQILFYSPHSWLTQWHINVMMTGISDQMWHLKHSLWHKSVQPWHSPSKQDHQGNHYDLQHQHLHTPPDNFPLRQWWNPREEPSEGLCQDQGHHWPGWEEDGRAPLSLHSKRCPRWSMPWVFRLHQEEMPEQTGWEILVGWLGLLPELSS